MHHPNEHRQFQGNNLGNLSDNELSGGTFVEDIQYVLYWTYGP